MLAEIGPDAKDRSLAAALLASMSDADVVVRAAARRAVKRQGAVAVPALTEAMRHQDVKIRQNAVEALGQLAAIAREAAPPLVDALKDPDKLTRVQGGASAEPAESQQPGHCADPDRSGPG